ncbi:hypothetical protein E2C01_083836 [Portunus trituberculatus]|uniref:Uncharacterized protein n=1 Tax=Portunus trituberculatus TaxID=210409 RepID=A0A5B7IY49_PORTR|nr:hypothetical protein [Portunus trituberculatus]
MIAPWVCHFTTNTQTTQHVEQPAGVVGGKQDDNQPHQNCINAYLYLVGGSVPHPPQLSLGPHPLQIVRSAKLLGVTGDDQLTWKLHVTATVISAVYRLYMLRRPKSLDTLHLSTLATRHQTALVKMDRGLLRHSRLRHLLSPDAPQLIHTTRHTNVVMPLKAPRTDRYHHSAIPSMVRTIHS